MYINKIGGGIPFLDVPFGALFFAHGQYWTRTSYDAGTVLCGSTVKFERVCSRDLKQDDLAKNHCVWLSPKAMADAHKERAARAERCYTSRNRKTISEFQSETD